MKSLLLTAFALLVTSPCYASISDGDFETPKVSVQHNCGLTPCKGYKAGQHFGPWNVSGNPAGKYVAELISSSASKGGVTYNAASGSQSLSISGPVSGASNCVSHYLGRGNNLGLTIIHFSVGHAPDSQGSGSIEFLIDGQDIGTYTNNRVTPGQINWRTFSYELVFAEDGPTISFCNNEVGSTYLGLDRVRVHATGD